MTAASHPGTLDCDVLIVGSGAAGHGEKVIVVERPGIRRRHRLVRRSRGCMPPEPTWPASWAGTTPQEE